MGAVAEMSYSLRETTASQLLPLHGEWQRRAIAWVFIREAESTAHNTV